MKYRKGTTPYKAIQYKLRMSNKRDEEDLNRTDVRNLLHLDLGFTIRETEKTIHQIEVRGQTNIFFDDHFATIERA